MCDKNKTCGIVINSADISQTDPLYSVTVNVQTEAGPHDIKVQGDEELLALIKSKLLNACANCVNK